MTDADALEIQRTGKWRGETVGPAASEIADLCVLDVTDLTRKEADEIYLRTNDICLDGSRSDFGSSLRAREVRARLEVSADTVRIEKKASEKLSQRPKRARNSHPK